MNSEMYLKRFFIETYNNENMYYEYLKGQVYLDYNLVSNWLKDMDMRNYFFSKSIESFNRLKPREIVVESALSNELAVSKTFFNKKEIIVSEFGKSKIEKKQLGESHNHYICNGYFNDTLEQIYNVLDKGSFTVGICAEKKTELYKEVVKYYGQLRSFLLKNGYTTAALETNCNSKNRIYLLMYDHQLKRR